MSAIATAITQLFSMFTVLFGAGEKFAKAIDNIATIAEDASGEYRDESTVKRQVRALELGKTLAQAKITNQV